MSTRKTGGATHAPVPALPTLYDVGRQIVEVNRLYTHYERERRELANREDRFDESRRFLTLEKAMGLLFDQEEALTKLGLTMVPETAADATVLLMLIGRHLDEIDTCEVNPQEAGAIVSTCLRAIRACEPILADVAGISVGDIDPAEGSLSTIARPQLWKPEGGR